MNIIYWNVYFRHNPQAVLSELKKVAANHRPVIIGLGEAKYMYNITDDVPGYRRIHLKPKNTRADENGDTAVLVRKDIEIVGYRYVRMTKKFRVPGHNFTRDPRVYIIVRFKYQGRVWKVYVAHWPFGPAQEETKSKVKWWFAAHLLKPVIHVGDLNAHRPEIVTFAKACRAKEVGVGIDRAIYKNIKSATVVNLGKRGSDHPMLLFKFNK